MSAPLIAEEVELGKMAGWVAVDIASSSGDTANAAGVGVGVGSIAGTPTGWTVGSPHKAEPHASHPKQHTRRVLIATKPVIRSHPCIIQTSRIIETDRIT